jgi:hypothetical protein
VGDHVEAVEAIEAIEAVEDGVAQWAPAGEGRELWRSYGRGGSQAAIRGSIV